jgi:hypothetical protein
MRQSNSSSQADSAPTGRSSPSFRVAETDLAILTAFCRPYLNGDGRFAVPAPNTEILRELADNGVYLDIDALRGHLRNLYAKFGVEDGLTPAQKRARLAELVYENRVIAAWEPREATPKTPPMSPGPPATASPAPPTSRRSAPLLPGPLVARRASRLRGSLHNRWWGVAGVAALLLAAVVVLTDLGGSERPLAPAKTPVIDPDKDAASAPHNFKCEPAEFCLGRRYNLTGGLYQNTISDPDLGDNTWFYSKDPENNALLGRVTDHSWSASNPTKRDVVVYDRRNYTGAAACIQTGRGINLPADWRQRISSFKFVPRSVCNRYQVLARSPR